MHSDDQHSRRGPLPESPGPRVRLSPRARIITVGNAKGGSGKSTTAMHLVARLMALGYRVNALDLDGQQKTLGRYLENRAAFAEKRGIELDMHAYALLTECVGKTHKASRDLTYGRFVAALGQAMDQADCVVLDCPGTDNFLSELGHLVADQLLTPINDSFIDLDLLAHCDPEDFRVLAPSWYSEKVWALRKRRYLTEGRAFEWVVTRNRVSHAQSRNKQAVTAVLTALTPLLGLKVLQGFGDRVIFRELFLRGLTLSDLKRYRTGVTMTMNHVAAHQEIKGLVAALGLKSLKAEEPAGRAKRPPPKRAKIA